MFSSGFSSGSRIIIPSSVSYHTAELLQGKAPTRMQFVLCDEDTAFYFSRRRLSCIGKTSMLMSRTYTSNSHRTQPFLKDNLLSWEEETFNFNFMIPPPHTPRARIHFISFSLGKAEHTPGFLCRKSSNASWRGTEGTEASLISSFG